MTHPTRRTVVLFVVAILLALAGFVAQIVTPNSAVEHAGRAGRAGRALITPQEAQAAQTTRLKASTSGRAIYYDTDYRNGYQWKRFQPGTSRSFDANDAVKTSGRSFCIVRSLYRVTCWDTKPGQARSVPVNEDDGTLQAYVNTGGRN